MPHSNPNDPPPPVLPPPLHLVSSRASSHHHQALRGADAANFPSFTTSGPQRTDEYLTRTQEGFLSPEEEEGEDVGGLASPSQTPTVVEKLKAAPTGLALSESRREKGLDIKIVTWKEDDPEDPRSWSFGIRW